VAVPFGSVRVGHYDGREREVVGREKVHPRHLFCLRTCLIPTAHRKRYYELRDEWCGVPEVFERQDILEERHRIDVDCRRTDRAVSLFAQPPASPEDKTASARYAIVSPQNGEIGAQSPSNEHTEQLAAILLTYGFYERELGMYNSSL